MPKSILKVQEKKISKPGEKGKINQEKECYLTTVFSFFSIPYSLIPISLEFAQRMEWKSNVLYLLRDDKEEIAEKIGLSLKRVEGQITICGNDCDLNILTRVTRGKYNVNPFLFPLGREELETRGLQLSFDMGGDPCAIAQVDLRDPVTGEWIRRRVLCSGFVQSDERKTPKRTPKRGKKGGE